MDDDPKDLDARIAAARARQDTAASAGVRQTGAAKYDRSSLAWRMVSELVAGMVIGVLLGLGLDSLLGTMPWLLVILSLAGFAAGVRVAIKSAQDAQRRT